MSAVKTFKHRWDIALGLNVARVLHKIARGKASNYYRAVSGVLPNHNKVSVSYDADDLCVMSTAEERVVFPFSSNDPIPLANVHMMSVGLKTWLSEKYRLEGFVEVENGDVVIDCGSFAAGFSMFASARAKQVYAFEPSPRNFKAVAKNVESISNVEALHMGLFNENKMAPFNLSATHYDDSLLAPDHSEGEGQTVDVQLVRLDDWAKEREITQIDFMKLEAEGVENEALEGIDQIPVRKFAIDCGPERDGESNLEELKAILQARGYETRERGWMLFAKKES